MNEWTSLLFPDFQYLSNPRDEAPYVEDALSLISVKWADHAKEQRLKGVTTSPFREKDWVPLRMEMQLLRTWKKWGTAEILGSRIEHHIIRYLCHLISNLEPDPWFQERIWSFYDSRERGKQVTNWFGAQNSGKSSTMAAMAVGYCALHPHLTRCTLSGPFKDAGESPLWSEVQSFFNEIKGEWEEDLARWSGAQWDDKAKIWRSAPDLTSCILSDASSRGLLRFSEMPKAGTLRLMAMDKVGKVQGAKSKDRRQQEGYILMFLDEIGAEYPTTEILRALPNICSNHNLHIFTGCNPFNPVGQLDGEFGRPTGGFESLNIDKDYVWNSNHNSRTYRFDGHRSPNIILGETRWPWLFDSIRKARLLARSAADSDHYNAQCRAFMPLGSGTRYVLAIPDIRQGAVDREFEWTASPKRRVAFLDPALSTDGDSAVYTLLELGTRREGNSTLSVVYAPKQVVLPIFTGMVATPEWQRKVRLVCPSKVPEEGTLVTVEDQLAVNAGYQLLLDQVERQNFAYDDSMRSKIMEAMLKYLGDGPKPMSSVGDAEDTPMYPQTYRTDDKGKRHLVTWKEDCQKFVSQVWFFGAAVVRSGFFRCHQDVMPALNEACMRVWSYAAGGRKRVVESKKDMKERNSGESPDHADSLFGAFHHAARMGLLQLRTELPTEHLSLIRRETFISKQWTQRKAHHGLHATAR